MGGTIEQKAVKHIFLLNIIMERLATTCQVLYDKDLLDKKNEIIKLKNKLAAETVPKILYENEEEWNNLKTESIKICQQGVRDFITDREYPFMRDFGINPGRMTSAYSHQILSQNTPDLESFLFGIGTSNLVKPYKNPPMLVNKVDTIKFFNQIDAQMPVPLVIEKRQRPSGPFS